ncbi:MAG: hypothetical protein J5586_03460 [Clostridia bacterium]|nr:hypothetical protein [Clostridia bacterium]
MLYNQYMMNKRYSITIDLAGVPLKLCLDSEESLRFFAPYKAADGVRPFAKVSVPDEAWAYIRRRGFVEDELSEAGLITAYASDALLETGMCLIHAVAVRKGDGAWLIAAPSGVGKSTQVRYLDMLFPGEFSVICGDRPVLQLVGDDKVLVHPSPWNGKEGWKGADSARLDGVICLKRGEENIVEPMKKTEAVIPVFEALIHSGSTAEQVRQLAAFEDELLRRTTVWRMINLGVPYSTDLLYNTLFVQEDRK